MVVPFLSFFVFARFGWMEGRGVGSILLGDFRLGVGVVSLLGAEWDGLSGILLAGHELF